MGSADDDAGGTPQDRSDADPREPDLAGGVPAAGDENPAGGPAGRAPGAGETAVGEPSNGQAADGQVGYGQGPSGSAGQGQGAEGRAGTATPWTAPEWNPHARAVPAGWTAPAGVAPAPPAAWAPAAGGPVPGYPGPGGHPPLGPGPPGPVPPPPRRTHRWGLGAYVLVEAVFLLASFAVALLFGARLSSSAGALAVALVAPTLLAAGAALLITRLRGNGPRIDLGLQWSWRDVGLGLAFGFGGLVITIPASILYVAIAGADTTSAVGEQFGGIRSGPLLAAVVFVIVVFVAPLCEEIVYRGLLWGAVERLGARRWWALGITTVVFALAHFEFARTPLLLVVAIPIALARLYSGRLVAGVVAHGVNNLLPAVSLVLMLLGVLPGT